MFICLGMVQAGFGLKGYGQTGLSSHRSIFRYHKYYRYFVWYLLFCALCMEESEKMDGTVAEVMEISDLEK